MSCATYPRRSRTTKSLLVLVTDRYLLEHQYWVEYNSSFVCWNEKCQEQITVQLLVWRNAQISRDNRYGRGTVQTGADTGCFESVLTRNDYRKGRMKKITYRAASSISSILMLFHLHNTLLRVMFIKSFVKLSYLNRRLCPSNTGCGYVSTRVPTATNTE